MTNTTAGPIETWFREKELPDSAIEAWEQAIAFAREQDAERAALEAEAARMHDAIVDRDKSILALEAAVKGLLRCHGNGLGNATACDLDRDECVEVLAANDALKEPE